MKYEDLKQGLGVLINECTYENFQKGFDPITELIDNIEVDYHDINPSIELYDDICYFQRDQCSYWYYYIVRIINYIHQYEDKKKTIEFKNDLIDFLKPNNTESVTKFLATDFTTTTILYIMSAALNFALGEYRSYYWGGVGDHPSEKCFEYLNSLFSNEHSNSNIN